jgi:hypothetical protein
MMAMKGDSIPAVQPVKKFGLHALWINRSALATPAWGGVEASA